MIANISRLQNFDACRQKEWDQNELHLMPHREADALMIGEAYHAGAAEFFASGDVAKAEALAESTMLQRLKGQVILAAERPVIDQEVAMAKFMVVSYAAEYKDFNVLWPEVKFRVPLPDSEHHCWFAHRLLHPDIPFDQCYYRDCWMPYYFQGRADAVIERSRMIWLLEQKTSADNKGSFWDKFLLDFQITGYIYGIWKATGTKPHGAIVNKVCKPRSNAVDKTILFEKEPFLRNDDDLARFETEFLMRAREYERAWREGLIYMNPSNCLAYNRKCYFFDLCLRHQEQVPGEFRTKDPDYVEEAYYEVLGIPKPTKETPSNAQDSSTPQRRDGQ